MIARADTRWSPRATSIVVATLVVMTTMPVVAQSSAAAPEGATCGSRAPGPVGEPQPNDGVPDPDGRIAYAPITRFDPLFGPIACELRAIDPDGSDHVMLLDCELGQPQWSPDGTRVAFTLGMRDGSTHVATMAADGSDVRVLTSGVGIHEIPTWSADGTWLAYGSSPSIDFADPAFSTQLWRIDADGSHARPLWDAETFDVEPRLSPDGTRVAFQRLHPDQDYASQFIIRDLASGDERALAPLGYPIEHPERAPDGRSLLGNASDWAPTAGTVYTIDADAVEEEPTILLDPSQGEWGGVKPVYSPDGERIVFVCHVPEGEDLCTMAADGTDVVPLVASDSTFDNHPAWGVAAPGA